MNIRASWALHIVWPMIVSLPRYAVISANKRNELMVTTVRYKSLVQSKPAPSCERRLAFDFPTMKSNSIKSFLDPCISMFARMYI